MSIPNSELVNQSVSNSNAGVLDCQVGVEFRLPYDVDLQKARAILFEAAATSRYIYLKKPIAVVVQDEFKEWFLTRIKVKAYVLDNRFEFAFASEIAETAKAAFNRMGIYPIEQVGVPLAAHGARSHEQTQDGDQEFPVKNPIERRTENK